jgi:hypothetical protein
MFPNDPLIAFGQAKATMAERHDDAAREQMARAARPTRVRPDGKASVSTLHRLAIAVGRLRGAVAGRTRAPRPAMADEPRTVAG